MADYVWVSLRNAMKAKQGKTKQRSTLVRPCDGQERYQWLQADAGYPVALGELTCTRRLIHTMTQVEGGKCRWWG